MQYSGHSYEYIHYLSYMYRQKSVMSLEKGLWIGPEVKASDVAIKEL